MLNIQEHTIRFWDSKLPDLSKRDNKGKTRFFNLKQIKKLSKLNDVLKKNDSIKLAYEIISKNNNKNLSLNIDNLTGDSLKFRQNIVKIKNISNNLKNLLN